MPLMTPNGQNVKAPPNKKILLNLPIVQNGPNPALMLRRTRRKHREMSGAFLLRVRWPMNC